MNARVNRRDVSYLISRALLVGAAVVALTGLASDLWDLNDFVYHKYAGYALAVMALAHVYLHWDRLVSYIRWRLAEHPKRRRASSPAEDEKRDAATVPGASSRNLLAWRTVISLLLGGLGTLDQASFQGLLLRLYSPGLLLISVELDDDNKCAARE